jgi:hypothetical protein
VADDVGGLPFPDFEDGEGPDNRDHGAADEVFAAVVLDEAFVEAARIHEPTAAERLLHAELERAEAEAGHGEPADFPPDAAGLDPLGFPGDFSTGGDPVGFDELYDDEGRFDRSDYIRADPGDGPEEPAPAVSQRAVPGRPPARWQRPVACVLAMVMGISMIAFALIAVQRAGSAQRTDPVPTPPATDPGGDDKGTADATGTTAPTSTGTGTGSGTGLGSGIGSGTGPGAGPGGPAGGPAGPVTAP